ncbi:DUF6011 domain-containing protein [Streptomyces sp. NPDC087850]|uniref:DUF6011 domain-containing protein n=1 Tax=Streptomyces sp. NPDC087850 TaxID=3365809 RepID=UPI0038001676
MPSPRRLVAAPLAGELPAPAPRVASPHERPSGVRTAIPTFGGVAESPRCRGCGRSLRDPVSRQLGIGPVCHRRLGPENFLTDSGRPTLRPSIPAPTAADVVPGQTELTW